VVLVELQVMDVVVGVVEVEIAMEVRGRGSVGDGIDSIVCSGFCGSVIGSGSCSEFSDGVDEGDIDNSGCSGFAGSGYYYYYYYYY